ncbi:MAG: FAD-binding oxidoreductase, partial [Deltaproteobacteria bacterium]|nr:FAD-binding oxidoreductase [Deltaproteobacteria bacterium]
MTRFRQQPGRGEPMTPDACCRPEEIYAIEDLEKNRSYGRKALEQEMGGLSEKADVVIIGGGIIGVSTAYYLAKKGARNVILLERSMLGSGATGKCAGGIRTQFSTEINLQFSILSRRVFDGFKDEFGVDPEFRTIGYLFVGCAREQMEVLEQTANMVRFAGVEIELLSPAEIGRRWPALMVEDLIGGSYTPGDGYAGPNEVLQGFARGARRLGVKIREGEEAAAIRLAGDRVEAVETSAAQRIWTPTVVNAAGPYAARVAGMAGLELPVRPLRRQVFFTAPLEGLAPRLPMVIDLEYGWYARGEGGGFLLAGPQDRESSFNEGTDFEGKEWAAARAVHRIPIMEQGSIARGWAGLYEISPDHHAIIGAFPELKGFICANGFSGHGFQHSPAAGMVVAEIILEGRPRSLDISPLRPERFRQGDLVREPLT